MSGSAALTMVITIAPNNADQNPLTWKLMPKVFAVAAVSPSIAALMTRMNNPSVSRISGQAPNIRIGGARALSKPKINATIPSCHQGPSNRMPGSSFTAIKMAMEVQIQRRNSFILVVPLFITYSDFSFLQNRIRDRCADTRLARSFLRLNRFLYASHMPQAKCV